MRTTRTIAVGLTVAAVASVATQAIASSAPTTGPHWTPHYRTIEVPHEPGPVTDDRVGVLEVGNPAARQVLVLAPGHFGDAGDFTELATDIADRLPDTQVWAAALDAMWTALALLEELNDPAVEDARVQLRQLMSG